MWEGLGGDGMEGESVWRDDWNWGAFEGQGRNLVQGGLPEFYKDDLVNTPSNRGHGA